MILHDISLRRAADLDFSDITDAKKTGIARWVGPNHLEIPFSRDLTPSEAEAVRRRLTTADATEESLVRAVERYSTQAAPDLTEIRAQVARLTELVLRYTRP